MDLFIPTKINKDNILGKGIGVKEAKRIAVGGIIGLALGLVLGLIFMKNIQAILIVTVISAVLCVLLTYSIVYKTPINMSAYIFIGLFISFLRKQKHYKFKKLREWY